ncbi:MAG TPA: glycosyltransferase family 2 protein [Solirubrobacterales bacterium]|nr:glycosyltransferase family 2 protein [Solirubrobacterales bacterium]
MKLVMTLLVRDEQDIIGEHLDFHLAQGVNQVIVTDNGSEDATLDILREYETRGEVSVIHEPSDDYSQGRWVTRMARMAAADLGADWVINSDADEFWWPRSGTLETTFRALDDRVGLVVARRTNFVPQPEDDRPFWERMTARERESLNPVGKPLPPKLAHRAHPEIEVVQGNHRVRGPELGERLDDGSIEILHFPMRSYAQFENKIVKGGAAYARNRELPEKIGRTWRRLYEVWQRGELPAHYAESVVSDAGRQDLIEDTRLRDYLRDQRLGAAASE